MEEESKWKVPERIEDQVEKYSLISRTFVELIIFLSFVLSIIGAILIVLFHGIDGEWAQGLALGFFALLATSISMCFLIVGVLKVRELEKINKTLEKNSQKHAAD